MSRNNDTVSFISTPGFCSDCGSILPLLGNTGNVICYACKREWGPEAFGDMAMSYTIHFNESNLYKSSKHKDDEKEEAEGPIVERKCPQCQNDKMSYATLQLRSADEGQTVFYTCTKCKYVFLNDCMRIPTFYVHCCAKERSSQPYLIEKRKKSNKNMIQRDGELITHTHCALSYWQRYKSCRTAC